MLTPRFLGRAIASLIRDPTEASAHSGGLNGSTQHLLILPDEEVCVWPRKPALRVRLAASLAKAIPSVLARVKSRADLARHPVGVAHALGRLAQANPGLRVPGAFDGFEVAVRAILGQQVTVAAARTLAGRFTSAFGTPRLRRRSRRCKRPSQQQRRLRYCHRRALRGSACAPLVPAAS